MLTASLTIALAATSSVQRDLSKATDPMSLSIAQAIADGVGLNQSNRIWADTRTLGSGATENINVYSFAGDTDPVGQALTLSRVTMVLIRNKNTTAGNKLVVGGEGSSAAWKSPFGASATASITIEPGGVCVLLAPSLAAYAVVNTTNHLLKILNSGSGSVDYDIVIMGSQ